MTVSDSPKIYEGMLKKELLEVADRLGLRGVKKLRKAELLVTIQKSLKRPKKKSRSRVVEKLTGRAEISKRTAAHAAKKKPTKAAANSTPPRSSNSDKARLKNNNNSPQQGGMGSEKAKKPQRKKNVAEVQGESLPTAPHRQSAADRPKSTTSLSIQSKVTAAKYGHGRPFSSEELRGVDDNLPLIPDGYGKDRVVLLPRDPEWLYTYWDVRNETKQRLRDRGGINLALRLYEVHGQDLEPVAEHWIPEHSRSWYIRVPNPGQFYVAEVGYRDAKGSWLSLLRSNEVNVPPSGPSSIIADKFLTLPPDAPLLRGRRTKEEKVSSHSPIPEDAARRVETGEDPHDAAYRASTWWGASGVPGSISGSMPSGPSSAQAIPPWSGSHHLSRQISAPTGEEKTRDFWLIADAELILFGATDPGATVSLAGQPIRLRQDGTFSIRMAFPDGEIHVPIEAVAADGEQKRGVSMSFSRSTNQDERKEG